MGDVLNFTNPKWIRLAPIYPASWEIHCIIIYDYLEREVPRPSYLSIFENKWLDRICGYRNREVYNYINDTRSVYDFKVTQEIYGKAASAFPQNVRWTKSDR